MFWLETSIVDFEDKMRNDFAQIFKEFPKVCRSIQNDKFGIAAASHLANIIRLHPDQELSSAKVEKKYAATFDAISENGVIDHDTCFSPGLDGFESPLYLVVDNSSSSRNTVEDISAAKQIVSTTSYSYVCERLSDIAVIALKKQHFPNTNQSYTIQSVLQTIYVDLYEHPILTAESLVHEHAHMTFNNYVKSKQIEFNPLPLYYSPWKEKKRPLFNFVHSLIAFSEVVNFIAELSKDDLDDQGRKYVDMKLKFELRNINSVRESAKDAIAVIPDPRIAELVETALERLKYDFN
jgi:hypothetical protein